MSNNLDHFIQSFVNANERKAKQQYVQHAPQPKQHAQVQKMGSNVITTTKATTAKLNEEQYKASIITLAIAHIKKKWSNA
jgi:hypothetical protein